MRRVVLAALYLVVVASCMYAAVMAYTLYELWDIKNEIGTVRIAVLQIVGAIVLGAGLPYCMIHYLKKT